MVIVYQTQNINTPAIQTAAGTAIASNPKRNGWSVQNLGTNPLFIRMGASASTSVFHIVLKASATNDDGTGGVINQTDGTVYTGEISVAGTTPRFTVSEM